MVDADPIQRLNSALEGRYRIDRELGEGGMATVYLAHDLRHERKVALKVLKPELGAVVGADRFLAEIKTTANLQHPHILPLFDSGEADGFLFYVMPYVEGESLRERLDREHQLPADDAVRITTNLAEALDYAHRQGVIHRDMKPANVLLQDGKPVISDFGIALAVSAGGGGRLTETGLSLGTPHYMSPEQATGDLNVGPQTDLYALGCVLYEMLVGEPPFTGSTPQAVLGKIITGRTPSAREERPSVPPNVDAVIVKALDKVPADRFRSAAELKASLSDRAFQHTLSETRDGLRTAPAFGALSVVGWSLAALFGVGLLWALRSSEAPKPVARFDVTPDAPQDFATGLPGVAVDISEDGQGLVYVGSEPHEGVGTQLYWRSLDTLESRPLPGTVGADNPRLSPDAQSVAFWESSGLKTVPLAGGPVISVVAEGGVDSPYIDWAPDGMLYFSHSAGGDRHLYRVPSSGGTPELLAAPPEDASGLLLPASLPGGRGVLVTVRRSEPAEATIAAIDLSTGVLRDLFRGMSARYSRTGHIVYATPDNTLMAVAFDEDKLEVTGSPVAVLQDVHVRFPGLGAHFALSTNGTLVYRSTSSADQFQVVWVDRGGAVSEVDRGWTFPMNYDNSALALSPSDDRLAISILNETRGADIWVKQLPRGPLSRLTFETGTNRRPNWSPDGSSITFISSGQVRRASADGTGELATLVTREGGINRAIVSYDGDWLVYRTGSPTGGGSPDLFAQRLGGQSESVELLTEGHVEWNPALSPDGRWLAYVSNETGRNEVYMRPFPDVDGAKYQVSSNGGWNPVWAHSGNELFYLRPPGSGVTEMIKVDIVTEPTVSAGPETTLFTDDEFMVPIGGFDVSSDDRRFAMFRRVSEPDQDDGRLILVQNFFDELERVVPN